MEVHEMEISVFLAIIGLYVIVSLLILPLQYRFLIALKEKEQKKKLKGKTQGEMYDDMNAGEQVLHGNMQGNPLFFLANLMATILYKIKHPEGRN